MISPCIIILLAYFRQDGTSFYRPSSLDSDFAGHEFYLFSLSRIFRLWTKLLFFSTDNFSVWQILPTSILMYLFFFFLYNSAKIYRAKRHSREEISLGEKGIALISLGVTLLYFLAPFRLGESSFINERFPWVIYLLLIPLLRIPDGEFFKKYLKFMIIAIVLISFGVNSMVLRRESLKVENSLTGLQAELPRGAFLVSYKRLSAESGRVDALLHVASYYGIYKKVVDVGNYEARAPFFPIILKKGLGAWPSLYEIEAYPEFIDWNLFPAVEFLLGMKIGEDDRIRLSGLFSPIFEDREITIWRRLYHR